MEVLNYLRQATAYLQEKWIPAFMKEHPKDAILCGAVLKEAAVAPKFILPDGGRIFNDGLRGLPDVLRLPFDVVVIEYECRGREGAVEQVFGVENTMTAPRRIVVARQVDDWVLLLSLIGTERDGQVVWSMQPWISALLKSTDYAVPAPEYAKSEHNGKPIDDLHVVLVPTGTIAPAVVGDNWRRNAYFDMLDEQGAVLELIEALSCSNVSHEAVPARKLNKSAAKRGALPFDEYRVLVVRAPSSAGRHGVVGDHRSPREHLRRGHIRRLPDGRRIWINSCVVNAGTDGKVVTTHDMRRAA